jgi:hypothetical protein
LDWECGRMRGETLFDRATADLPGDVRESLLRLLLHLKADLNDPSMVAVAVAGHIERLVRDVPAALAGNLEQFRADMKTELDRASEVARETQIAAEKEIQAGLMSAVRDGALNLARDQARAEGRRRFVSALAAAFLVTGGVALGIHRENAEVREALVATHRAELAALKERFEAAVDARAGEEVVTLRWARPYAAQVDDPEFRKRVEFAARNPRDMEWFMSAEGRAMLRIGRFYPGQVPDTHLPYPCMAETEKPFNLDDRLLRTCVVALGF